ncbi:hypothetical protein OKW12_004569 [Pseudomonas silensiensis]|nr:hypothetical protein [Pseudomonas silensiensis]
MRSVWKNSVEGFGAASLPSGSKLPRHKGCAWPLDLCAKRAPQFPTIAVGIGCFLCYIPRPRFFISTPVIVMQTAKPLFDYPKYWAECFGPAPFLPMSREEMDQLGWDSCDIIIVTGDAYVDHPSFGMAIIGRLLESQGFRVGIIAQPNWQSKDDFMKLGEPNLFFGVAAGATWIR